LHFLNIYNNSFCILLAATAITVRIRQHRVYNSLSHRTSALFIAGKSIKAGDFIDAESQQLRRAFDFSIKNFAV